MSSLITEQFRIHSADKFLKAFDTTNSGTNSNNIYFFIGRHESWYTAYAANSNYGTTSSPTASEGNVPVNLYFGIDPASSVSDNRDYSVVMVVGVSEEHDYYVIDYWRQRCLPMDCAEQIFKMFKKYEPIRRVNIETIAYQEMLRDYVMRESKKRGLFLPGIEQGIKGYTQKKKDRLFEGLQPLFRQKAVHMKREHGDFVDELIDFPKGAHDDIIDAFWLATQFTRGHQKAGGMFKRNARKERKSKKIYNWMTGQRSQLTSSK